MWSQVQSTLHLHLLLLVLAPLLLAAPVPAFHPAPPSHTEPPVHPSSESPPSPVLAPWVEEGDPPLCREGDIPIPREDKFRAGIHQKKITIIFVILFFSLIGAFILSFVNISHDLQELQYFYRGYMGRRLMINEQRLLFRNKETLQKTELGTAVNYIRLEPREEELGLSLLTCSQHRPSQLGHSRRYVEDEEPEWRSLDYRLDVGAPPTTFCGFLRQYDCGVFNCDRLTPEQLQRRQNLLGQFRRWKKRKRKNFSIIVTERVRREMGDQEEQKNKKRQTPGKPPG